MTRFEIQDIIRQNRDGVTFRALDKSNDQIVSLRRFFPFGQCDENEEGGEGLDPTEGKAFSTACERLSNVQHPALRKTIYGDIDPIDGMPYLVTEWIEGESLSNVLGNTAMPADMTIALVQQVFDVCKLLSETLQSEAIWIDTNPQSIIVCNPNETPTFSFRICPFKWLGTSRAHLKDMSSIVSLIEALMGWKSKLVSDQAGKGLGGYIKLLRQYPEMDINKAIQSLPNHSYEVVEVVSETNTKTPTTLFPPIPTTNASFFNKKSITIMSISAIVTGALIFFFYQQRANQTNQNIIVESEVYDPANDPGIISNPKIVTPDPEPPKKTPDTTETDSENKTATNTNVPPIDPTDTTPKEKDPKESEKTAETDKKAPAETVQTDKTLASTAWSPISIPSVVWYDASTASIKDGTVTIANAGSGGGTISGPASLVENGIGNLQAVQFTPNNTYLTGDYINTGNTLTAFFVGKSLNVSQTAYAGMMCIWQDRMLNDYDNIGSTVLFNQDNLKANTVQTYRLSKELSTTTGNLTAGFIAGTVFNGTTNTSYLNGNAATSINSVGNFNTSKIVLGARWHMSSHRYSWNGNFGEAIIFNTELSESDRQKIEGYLAHKWGLTGDLPANHPYKSSAPGSPSSKTETLVNLPTKETPTEKPKTIPENIRSWSPDEITAAAWYDAADSTTITASSSKVSQWRDKSGNDLHLAQSTAAQQPKTGSQINGLNALDFTLNAMTTAKNPFGSSVSNAFVIAVYKVDSIQDGTLFSLTGSEIHTSRWNAQAPFGDKFMYFDCGGVIPGSTRVSVKDYGVIPGNAVLASFYSSATDDLQQVYKNGNLLVGDTSGHAVSTVGNISVGGIITSIPKTTSYQDATIGEMIIINGTVDEATRQKLEGYLAHKWGTTANLPANHPYKSSVPIPSILTSSDVGIIKTLEVGDPVTLQGTVKSAKFSSTGKSIYLSFSDPEVETDVRVVIHGNEYDGTAFTEEEFAKLVGKNLVFNGTVYTESFNDRPPFVKITEKAQIKLATKSADKPSTPEKAKARPIFTPDDADAIAKLELKEPVAVRGVVKSVKIPKPGGGLYFSFSDPFDRKQIQVVTYPSPFEDGPHDATSFKKIEAEFQHLVGKTVTFNGSASRQKDNSFQFVFISKREQIVVEETTDKGTSEVQNQNEKPIEADPLNNIKTGTRIQLKGTLRAVKMNNDGNAMVLLFAVPYQPGQLRGVAYKLNYKDEFDIKNFEPFVGKPISIEGLLIIDGNKDKFVEITNLNQVSLIQK